MSSFIFSIPSASDDDDDSPSSSQASSIVWSQPTQPHQQQQQQHRERDVFQETQTTDDAPSPEVEVPRRKRARLLREPVVDPVVTSVYTPPVPQDDNDDEDDHELSLLIAAEGTHTAAECRHVLHVLDQILNAVSCRPGVTDLDPRTTAILTFYPDNADRLTHELSMLIRPLQPDTAEMEEASVLIRRIMHIMDSVRDSAIVANTRAVPHNRFVGQFMAARDGTEFKRNSAWMFTVLVMSKYGIRFDPLDSEKLYRLGTVAIEERSEITNTGALDVMNPYSLIDGSKPRDIILHDSTPLRELFKIICSTNLLRGFDEVEEVRNSPWYIGPTERAQWPAGLAYREFAERTVEAILLAYFDVSMICCRDGVIDLRTFERWSNPKTFLTTHSIVRQNRAYPYKYFPRSLPAGVLEILDRIPSAFDLPLPDLIESWSQSDFYTVLYNNDWKLPDDPTDEHLHIFQQRQQLLAWLREACDQLFELIPTIRRILDYQDMTRETQEVLLMVVFGRSLLRMDKWEIFSSMVGDGGCGKSLMLDLICAMFPDSGRARISASMESADFALGSLTDQTQLVCIDETPRHRSNLQAATFKTLVSGGELQVNPKYARVRTVRPNNGCISIVLAGNNPLQLRGAEVSSDKRRGCVFRFPNQPPSRDTSLPRRASNESLFLMVFSSLRYWLAQVECGPLSFELHSTPQMDAAFVKYYLLDTLLAVFLARSGFVVYAGQKKCVISDYMPSLTVRGIMHAGQAEASCSEHDIVHPHECNFVPLEVLHVLITIYFSGSEKKPDSSNVLREDVLKQMGLPLATKNCRFPVSPSDNLNCGLCARCRASPYPHPGCTTMVNVLKPGTTVLTSMTCAQAQSEHDSRCTCAAPNAFRSPKMAIVQNLRLTKEGYEQFNIKALAGGRGRVYAQPNVSYSESVFAFPRRSPLTTASSSSSRRAS